VGNAAVNEDVNSGRIEERRDIGGGEVDNL